MLQYIRAAAIEWRAQTPGAPDRQRPEQPSRTACKWITRGTRSGYLATREGDSSASIHKHRFFVATVDQTAACMEAAAEWSQGFEVKWEAPPIEAQEAEEHVKECAIGGGGVPPRVRGVRATARVPRRARDPGGQAASRGVVGVTVGLTAGNEHAHCAVGYTAGSELSEPSAHADSAHDQGSVVQDALKGDLSHLMGYETRHRV